MSGSSKSLIRALESVFIEWDATHGQVSEKEPLPESVVSVIRSFHARHNTLQIIQQSTSIHEQLFSIYNTHIKPTSDLEREICFAAILTQMVGVLTKHEIDVWLHTYLKPAIDSAGYDMKFVMQSRHFLRAVMAADTECDDLELNKYRHDLETHVVDVLVQLQIGKESAWSEYCELAVRPANNTQAHLERLRYAKANCFSLIKEYTEHKPVVCFEILDTYIHSVDVRLETITLLAALVAPPDVDGARQLSQTPLWSSLLQCLLYDCSHAVVTAALPLATMVVPHLATTTGATTDVLRVPELFAIFYRVLVWDHMDLGAQASLYKGSWAISPPDPSSESSSGLLFHGVDYKYFATMLYGMFPFTFRAFTRSPAEYFKKYCPNLIDATAHNQVAVAKTKELLRALFVHPKYLDVDECDLQDETKDPLEWMRNGSSEQPSADQISVACFSLNPEILATASERDSHHSSPGNSHHKAPKPSNYGRKMSVIPTELVIEPQSIQFKDVQFNRGASSTHEPTLPISPEQSEPLVELFDTHESLFGPGPRPRSRSRNESIPEITAAVKLADKHKHELLINKISSPTTSLDTAPVHKDSIASSGGSVLSSEKTEVGTSLDFYQRELLLLKNELEFSSYMKHLNKFRYIQLKNHSSKPSVPYSDGHLEVLRELNQTLHQTVDSLRQQLETVQRESTATHTDLVAKLVALQNENHELARGIEDARHEKSVATTNLADLEEIVARQNLEVGRFRTLVSDMEHQIDLLKQQPQQETPRQSRSPSPAGSAQDQKLLRVTTETHRLSAENAHLREEVTQLKDTLDSTIDNYEKKLASSKLDLSENLHSFGLQYEKKINELSTTVLKYEALLEEKNARLIQFLASKPISIPITPEYAGSHYQDSRPHGSHSSSGLVEVNKTGSNTSMESLKVSSPPPQNSYFPQFSQPAPSPGRITPVSAAPIVRGRGGYQKRSKKLM